MSFIEKKGGSAPPAGSGSKARPIGEQDALVSAELLLTLVRARRQYLDDFLDGDGPFWISIGLFIDGENGTETSLERVIEFADESIETSRYILRRLIDRHVVQQYRTGDGDVAYRLSAPFAVQFSRYLIQQTPHIRNAHARLT
ncbi:hypothetical protein [Sphingobium indicum]